MLRVGFGTMGEMLEFGFGTFIKRDFGRRGGKTYPKPPHFKPAIKILISGSSLKLRIALVRLSRLRSPVR
jgi:hypothetical protein